MSSGSVSRHGMWSNRWLFVLAAAGSAVGLGNIWKFPYIAGENGGGAFVLIYLVCVAFVGIPIMMADETTDEDADTRALRVLLRLSEHADYVKFQDKLIVELLDGENRDLVDGLGVRDIVVTSDLISAQLAQVSQQQVLGSIYRELLSAGGVEFSLRPVAEYIALGEPCRFDDLTFAAQQHSEIAIGLHLSDREVVLNPAREKQWQLGEEDKLIVLAQQIYR